MANSDVIFVLGGPGCGKGTQCERIVEKYGWQHCSSGDLLRMEVEARSELGKQVQEYVQEGKLVPDEIMMEVVKAAINKSQSSYVLLDGFPRTIPQIQLFEQQVQACMAVIYFAAHNKILKQRLKARGRSDDTDEAIRQRLEVYREQTMPVITHYMKLGKVIQIDASRSPDEVFLEVAYNLDEALREQENDARQQDYDTQGEAPQQGNSGDEPRPKKGIVGLLRKATQRLSWKKLQPHQHTNA